MKLQLNLTAYNDTDMFIIQYFAAFLIMLTVTMRERRSKAQDDCPNNS